jgi:hypothetical protein
MQATTYTAGDFVREIAAAMEHDEWEAQRRTSEVMKRACATPSLLDGYREQIAAVHEFELLKTPRAAIKVFILSPKLGLGVPHDHAGLWGCYAAHTNPFWMETYREADESEERVEPVERRLMQPGEIRFMGKQAIHAVWAEEPCLLLTAYNGDLNSLPRRIFDRENGRMIRGRSRWAERRKDGKVNFDLSDS